jgi:DNA-binding CsgD family transcriptional regulator
MPAYPYSHGWPLWPFTRLSPKEMERLLKKIEGQSNRDVLDNLEEAPW